MPGNLPPQQVSAGNPGPQPPSLVSTHKEYVAIANSQPHLTHEECRELFTSVSDAWTLQTERATANTPVCAEDRRTIAEGQAARHRIATAFLSLVIAKAFERRSYDNSVINIPIEDLIGIGNLLLYHAIDSYAKLPDRQAFAPYVETTLRQGLRKELWVNWLGVNVNSTRLDEIIAYRNERKELARKRGRTVSPAEVAEVMGIDLDRARHLECFARDRILVEDLVAPGRVNYLDQEAAREYAEAHEPESMLLAISREKKSVLIERALTTVHRAQATVLRLHFGLDGEPSLDTESIAAHLQILESVVKEKIGEAIGALRDILPQIEDQTFDYAAWQGARVNSPKTVLTFLSANKIPIPEEFRLPELRALARDNLQKIDYNNRYKKLLNRDREVITDYYGLNEDGRKFLLKDLLQKHGITSTVLYGIERRVLTAFEALHEAEMDTNTDAL